MCRVRARANQTNETEARIQQCKYQKGLPLRLVLNLGLRDGKFLEVLGWYDTQIKENNFKIDLARVDYWVSKGAKPSTTVASLIRRAKNPNLKPHHATKAKALAKKAVSAA